MKSIILVALALAAVAVAAPVEQVPEIIAILKSAFDPQPDGSYKFGFESENGIVRNEEGQLKEVIDEDKKPHVVVIVRGSYSYTNPDGQVETINYSADENGYTAEGPSIPKAARR